jgi:hypothetical protein
MCKLWRVRFHGRRGASPQAQYEATVTIDAQQTGPQRGVWTEAKYLCVDRHQKSVVLVPMSEGHSTCHPRGMSRLSR